jgi:WD40 repeat protein
MANKWYIPDYNSNPPKYVLKKLDTVEESNNSSIKICKIKDDDYFEVVLPSLRSALLNIQFSKHLCRDIKIGKSISEWEVKYALKNDKDVERALWIHRIFKKSNNMDDNYYRLYSDTNNDNDAKNLLKSLKEWMSSRFARTISPRIQTYDSTITYEDYRSGDSESYRKYCQLWEKNAFRALREELYSVIRKQVDWNEDACGMGIPGYYMEIFLHHAKYAHENCKDFFGRNVLIEKTLELIDKPNRPNVDPRIRQAQMAIDNTISACEGVYNAISVAVIGLAGTGKTSFMAQLAHTIYEREVVTADKAKEAGDTKSCPAPRPVLIRFCGTSDDSLHSSPLIHSLRIQIEYLLGPTPKMMASKVILSDEEAFADLVLHHALFILLDDIEEISDGIDFLKDLTLHPNTRIILSTTRLGRVRMDDFLTREEIPMIEIPVFSTATNSANGESEMHQFLKHLLARKHRTLTDTQWQYVKNKLTGSPSPLYISLAVRLIEKWTSYMEAPFLGTSVSGIVTQILDEIESTYGAKLTRTALGLITFSVRGLSDSEIEDLISFRDDVLYEVLQYDYTPKFRLPTHVWSKLRQRLSGLVTEGQMGCLCWHHEDVKSIAEERYSHMVDEKEELYGVLGEYFGNIGRERVVNRNILNQPLCYSNIHDNSIVWYTSWKKYLNIRRVQEAAHHFVHAGSYYYEAAVNETCRLEYICAVARTGDCSLLQSLLEQLHKNLLNSSSIVLYQRVNDYLNYLRANINMISLNPSLYIFVTSTREPMNSQVYKDAMEVLRNLRCCKGDPDPFDMSTWVRGFNVCSMNIIHGLASRDIRHIRASWSPDGNKVAATLGDNVLRVWDFSPECVLVSESPFKSTLRGLKWNSVGDKSLISIAGPAITLWDDNKCAHVFQLSDKSICEDGPFAVNNNSSFVAVTITSPSSTSVAIFSRNNNTSAVYSTLSINKKQKVDIIAIQWSHDSKHIAVSTAASVLNIFEMSSPKAVGNEISPKLSFNGHADNILCIAWSSDNTRIVSCSQDSTCIVWNPVNAAVHHVFNKHACAVTCCDWSVDNLYIASGSSDGMIIIWNSYNGNVLSQIASCWGSIQSIEWHKEYPSILCAYEDSSVIVWQSIDEPSFNDENDSLG